MTTTASSCAQSARASGSMSSFGLARAQLPFTSLATSRASRSCTPSQRVSPQPMTTSPRGLRIVASALDTSTKPQGVEIEKLDKEYCDDFVCTSSPAVEQSVRTFMKCLERSRFIESLFQKDTTYSDPFRSFTGAQIYTRHSWILENVKAPRTVITKVQMLDKATAKINWQLTGQIGVAPIDIAFTSVIEMNLLTGRILSNKESWDLSKLPAPVSVIVNASRAFWSAKQGSKDAQEGLGRAADSIASLGSTDEDSGQIYRDPTDPNKFFQQGPNQQYNDMLWFAIIVVAMYAVFKGFSTIIKL